MVSCVAEASTSARESLTCVRSTVSIIESDISQMATKPLAQPTASSEDESHVTQVQIVSGGLASNVALLYLTKLSGQLHLMGVEEH